MVLLLPVRAEHVCECAFKNQTARVLRACAYASGYSKNAQKNEHKNFSSASHIYILFYAYAIIHTQIVCIVIYIYIESTENDWLALRTVQMSTADCQ